MKPARALGALVLLAASAAAGQKPPAGDPIEAYRRGVAALEAKDAARASAELSAVAAAMPGHPDPTTGAVAGDVYCYLANSQLSALGPGGVVKEPEKLRPVVVLRLDLPR